METRSRIGDWEGDLIVGRASRSAIGTLVDRTSRCLRLIRLPAGHAADAFAAAAAAVLEQLPAQVWLTLTWDQGSEMARHDLLNRYLADGIYFAHPASPWLRGTNENTNGLLRQYWPKGSDLSSVTDDQLRAIETRLNERPRKILDWKTPAGVFATRYHPSDHRVATTARIRRAGHQLALGVTATELAESVTATSHWTR